jgi:acyl-CoA thioester hydrolase
MSGQRTSNIPPGLPSAVVTEGPVARRPPAHVVHHRVVFGETDAGGVVFYPNYLTWFDRGTHELFRSLGLPLKELQETWSILPPLVSVEAHFHKALHYDEEIEIRSEIAELSERTVKVGHTILRDGVEVASGWELRAWVRPVDGTFRAASLPDELRARLT